MQTVNPVPNIQFQNGQEPNNENEPCRVEWSPSRSDEALDCTKVDTLNMAITTDARNAESAVLLQTEA